MNRERRKKRKTREGVKRTIKAEASYIHHGYA
jgi:hypothetical protein